MQAERAAMKEQAATAQAAQAEADKAQSEKIAAVESKSADNVQVKWKGAPEISGDGWSFKPRGRLQYDIANVSGPDGLADRGLGFSNELRRARLGVRSEEHTSELPSLMRISYAVFCLKKKNNNKYTLRHHKSNDIKTKKDSIRKKLR